jgi:hypothetical protein
MTTMTDLNTKMANYAKSCEGRAAEERQAAAGARAQQKTGWEQYDDANVQKAHEHDKMAKRWDARATYAKTGRMTTHGDAEGIRHQFEYRDLHAEAASAHRSTALTDDNLEIK